MAIDDTTDTSELAKLAPNTYKRFTDNRPVATQVEDQNASQAQGPSGVMADFARGNILQKLAPNAYSKIEPKINEAASYHPSWQNLVQVPQRSYGDELPSNIAATGWGFGFGAAKEMVNIADGLNQALGLNGSLSGKVIGKARMGLNTAGDLVRQQYDDGTSSQGLFDAGQKIGSLGAYGFGGAESRVGQAALAGGMGALSGLANTNSGNYSDAILNASKGAAAGTGAALGLQALGSGAGKIYDTFTNMFGNVNNHTARAATSGLLNSMGSAVNPSGLEFRDTAQSILNNVKKNASASVSKMFDDATPTVINSAPGSLLDAAISGKPSGKYLTDTYAKLLNDPTPVGNTFRSLPSNSIGQWQMVKNELDSLWKTGDKNSKPLIQEAKQGLLEAADAANPLYSAARAMSGDTKDALKGLGKDIIGQMAKTPQGKMGTIANIAFRPTQSIDEFNATRDAFIKQNPDTWNQIVGSYIQSTLDKAKGTSNGVMPSTFANLLLDPPEKARMLNQAFEGQPIVQAKLQVLGKLYNDASNEASSAASEALKERARASLGHIQGLISLKPNEMNKFNKQAVNFLLDGKNQEEFVRTMGSQLPDDAKISHIVNMIQDTSLIRPTKTTSKIFSIGGGIVGARTAVNNPTEERSQE